MASDVHPGARRVGGAFLAGGAFHLVGGFGARGTVRPDDVAGDLWRFDAGWDLLLPDGPDPSRYPSCCAAPQGIYRFGGCGTQDGELRFFDRLWRLNDGEWRQADAASRQRPAGRYTSALAWTGERLLMFGGNRQDGKAKTFFADLWSFEPDTTQWQQEHGAERGPGQRYGFGWTATDTALYLFGGFDGEHDRGDLWRLDLTNLEWRCLAEDALPPPRYCPALGNIGDDLVLFGGRSKTDSKRNFEDTWRWNGRWSCLKDGGPGYHAKSAYASDGHALWIYGGEGPRGHLSDLWRFTDDGWACLSPARGDDPTLWGN